MRILSRWAFPVLLLFVSSTIAQGAADPLEAIPDSAGVVVRMKSPKATLARIADFAGKADPAWKAFLDQGSERLGLMIYNQSLAGVDAKGDWWVAVFPQTGGEPGIVFAVPVTDAEAAKKETGTSYQYVKHENWLLYTDHSETFQAVEKRTKGEGKSIVATIDRTSRGLIEGADIAAFVNVKQLRETYRADIDSAKESIEAALKQGQNAQPAPAGINPAAVTAVYSDMVQHALQVLDDTEGYAVAGRVGDRGVDIEQFAKFTTGSSTDKFLQSNPPSELAAVGKLPTDQLVYYGLHADMKSMVDWGTKLTTSMFSDATPEMKAALQSITEEMSKLKLGDTVGSMNVGSSSEGILRYATYVQVDQPDKMRELYRKSTESMAKLSVGPIKQEIKIQQDAEKYGDRSADVMTLKQEVDPMNDPLGMQKKMLDTMYGPNGMVTRIVILKDAVVQSFGGGKEAMETLLKAVEASTPPADSRKPVRDHLSKQANVLLLIDLPGLAASFIGTGSLPIPVDAEAIKKAVAMRSYFGTTIVAEPQAVRAKSHFPLEQLKGIAQLVKVFQGAMGGPM
ncbi:MAG: hypothetical protein AB7O26_12650 [Planctomycetaceae bacterium]